MLGFELVVPTASKAGLRGHSLFITANSLECLLALFRVVAGEDDRLSVPVSTLLRTALQGQRGIDVHTRLDGELRNDQRVRGGLRVVWVHEEYRTVVRVKLGGVPATANTPRMQSTSAVPQVWRDVRRSLH